MQLVSLAILIVWAALAWAQTVSVEITPTHMANRFVPTQTLGAGVDRLPAWATDQMFTPTVIQRLLSAGWQPVTYRQNTELYVQAWHWNPKGTWSDPAGRGYFTGDATPGEFIRHSYGYRLPHRGFTRNEGTGTEGYSRLTDGDVNTYWKSNPYLSKEFSGEDDAFRPQWVILDLATEQLINGLRIAWADPYARKYLVQYWTGEDPIKKPTAGAWVTFANGEVANGKGGTASLQLSPAPMAVRFIRLLMTQSSNTCDTHGDKDRRNCVGYAIRELFAGTITADGKFHDLLRHTADQDQTTTYCSSVDPWHEPADLDPELRDQVGFDLFFTSGITRGLPAIMPISLLYGTPEDSAAEIDWLKKRGYPVSYVEMGEEADGQYMLPEDYAALYLQWATAIHKIDPAVKLGGPSFQGVNKDIEVWPDAEGRTSWTARFIDYLKKRGRLADLAFFSFEHYPLEPCKIQWSSLYDEANLVTNIMRIWRQDGVPANIPMLITESNISWQSAENSVDIFGALWLADYIGAYLAAGGNGVYFFHYIPLGLQKGCNDSFGSFGLFTLTPRLELNQPTAQFFASQLINLEWVQPGNGVHRLFPAATDIQDAAGHVLVTSYALQRPDAKWAVMLVNKDQENPYDVRVVFRNSGRQYFFDGRVESVTFGSEQYRWHPREIGGGANPDGPSESRTIPAGPDTLYRLPPASITILRGTLGHAQ